METEEIATTLPEQAIEVCVPLMNETVWLLQNKYEEAESFYHREPSGGIDKKLSEENHTSKVSQELSHPFLGETVWLQQNIFEEAEAHYLKVQTQGISTTVLNQDADSSKKIDKNQEKKASTKKTEAVSWAQKLQSKLTAIQDHSKNLGDMVDHFQKAQVNSQDLMVRLTSALEAGLKRLNKELQGNQEHIASLQNFLICLNSSVGNIKKCMATKDRKSYKSYQAFCQAMSDRLQTIEEEMDSLDYSRRDEEIASWNQNMLQIIEGVNNIPLKINASDMHKSKSKVASLITGLDSILKKDSPNKFEDHDGFETTSSSLSTASLKDFSSLSGECSDFGPDIDDIEEYVLPVHSGAKAKSTNVSHGGQNSTPASRLNKKKGQKKEALTYKQLQSNHPKTAKPSASFKEIKGDLKKSPKQESYKGVQKKNSGDTSQHQKQKTKTFHNRSPKSSPSSSEMAAMAAQGQMFSLSPNNTSPLFSMGSSSSANSSFNNNSFFNGGASAAMSPPQPFGSAQMFTPSVFPEYSQLSRWSPDPNPVIFEQALSEMAQKLQQMHVATKQTLDLQQMLQETERLRQLALESQQQKLLQDQFQQRYQMLLSAFTQYQKIFMYQQSQQQQHQPSQGKVPKSQTQNKGQPSAKLQNSGKKQRQRGGEKKANGQSHQPVTKSKESPKTKKQSDDLSQVVSSLPGAVKSANAQPASKSKVSEIIQLASFSPRVHMDQQNGGISSMVVMDNLSCLLIVDIINSCLKLYHFSLNGNSQRYHFRLVATLDLPNPFYMARLSQNEVIITRNGSFVSIVQVSSRHLKVVNSLETGTQYYGITFVRHNTVAAAAYEVNEIDLLRIEKQSSLQISRLVTTPFGPELLASIPATKDIAYLDKHPDGRIYLKAVNLRGEQVFNVALGRSTMNVWNLSCEGDTVLCLDKHKNKLMLFSSLGKRQGSVSYPAGTVNQPFAVCFGQNGDLFLANDGAWESEGNHYITTEVNVFTFVDDNV